MRCCIRAITRYDDTEFNRSRSSTFCIRFIVFGTTRNSGGAEPSGVAIVQQCLAALGDLDCVGHTLHESLCEPAKGSEADYKRPNTLYSRFDVPPLGLAVCTTAPAHGAVDKVDVAELSNVQDQGTKAFQVSNHFFILEFSKGQLQVVTDWTAHGHTTPSTQSLAEYESFSEVVNQTTANSWPLAYIGARSGPYLLHSSPPKPAAVPDVFPMPRIQVAEGRYVTKTRQQFSRTHVQVWSVQSCI